MSAAHDYWQRVSESLRSGEWRCTQCGIINSTDLWYCGECRRDIDGNEARDNYLPRGTGERL